jgi:hypothetical protein
MKKATFITALLAAACCFNVSAQKNDPDLQSIKPELFKNPPAEFRGVQWMGYGLSNLTDSGIVRSIRRGKSLKTWGSILLGPGGGPTTGLSTDYMKYSHRTPSDRGVPYLSEEYFRIYKVALQEGMKSGYPVSTMYDEWNYPSGIVDGQFYSKYPQDCEKSLEKVEKNAAGPSTVKLAIPAGGIYIGAVIMNTDNFQRIDISKQKAGNTVTAKLPKGNWKAMAFYLKNEFRPQSQKGGAVDYLNKESVAKYIHMNFDPYYDHLKEFFGTEIKRTFYDEPSMHLVDGRMWTTSFNSEFQQKYHYSPMTLYPALWYDIGKETVAARNALFGLHAQEYSDNYIGQVAAWDEAHGIKMAGHEDQEEARNPVAINGDMMKVFKHQQIPSHDDIYYTGRSNSSYKLITSAAYNWDRPECMAETYAAYRKIDTIITKKTALDQFTMGINIQLGGNNKTPAIDDFVGRSCYLLRGGRHAADIAILYPIASLQAAYSFSGPVNGGRGSSADFYYALEGGIVPPETDYMDLGEMLFRSMRIDYTWLHPEVLVEKGLIQNHDLVLDNKINREDFKVLILPGGDVLSADVAKKVLEFYRAGGVVIATSKLPTRSAEFNRDKEIKAMVTEVFGISDNNPLTAQIAIMADDFNSYFKNSNTAGGRSYFIPRLDIKMLGLVLKESLPVKDVDIQQAPTWPLKTLTDYDGSLTYTHKVKDGRDIYYFSNSTDQPVNTQVAFRGDKNLELWNPHTGEMKKAGFTKGNVNGQLVTTAKLIIPPVSAIVYESK